MRPGVPPALPALFALVAAGAALPACARAPAGGDAARPLEVVIPASPATLDPRFATDAYAVKVTRLVHAGLVRLDPDTLAPLPYLARSFRWENERTLEVELRDDVRFHSGAPFDATDVCATVRALQDPALGSPQRAQLRKIGACAPEGSRVRLVLSEPSATLLTDLELPLLRRDQAHAPPRPDGDLDGLGPYAIASVDDGAIALAPAWGSPLPRPAHALAIRAVKDENARALRLLAGRADVAPNAISPTLLPALEGRAGLEVHARPGANVTYLLIQDERAPLDRVPVRRAIAAALDTGLVTRTLLDGRAHPAACIFPSGSPACPADLAPPAHDAAAARAVLAPLGRPLTLLSSTDRLRATVARAIAQQLGDAGLAVEPMPLDLGVLLDRLNRGDYDLAILQMPELTEPDLLRWFFHSASIPQAGRPVSGANRARWRSPEADAWLDEAARALDSAARAELYAKVARRMREEMPVVPLWHEDQVAVASPRARAFVPAADGRWLGMAGVP